MIFSILGATYRLKAACYHPGVESALRQVVTPQRILHRADLIVLSSTLLRRRLPPHAAGSNRSQRCAHPTAPGASLRPERSASEDPAPKVHYRDSIIAVIARVHHISRCSGSAAKLITPIICSRRAKMESLPSRRYSVVDIRYPARDKD